MSFPERWDDLTPDMRDAILRVAAGELTADEAMQQLQEQGDPLGNNQHRLVAQPGNRSKCVACKRVWSPGEWIPSVCLGVDEVREQQQGDED